MRDILNSNSNGKINWNQNKHKSESISIFPSFIINNKLLLSLKEKLKNISWEKDGIILLSKFSFSQNDIKAYKLLLIKQSIPLEYKGEFCYILIGAKKENIKILFFIFIIFRHNFFFLFYLFFFLLFHLLKVYLIN